MSDPTGLGGLKRPRSEVVEFDGDRLIAIVLEGDGVAVPLRLVCEALGLDLDSQSRRLREHEVLSQGLRVVNAQIGQSIRSVMALLHTYIPFYLATISPNQVREPARPKLIRYQQELVTVLAQIYGGEMAPQRPLSSDPSLAVLQQRFETALLELQLAREAYIAQQQQTQSRLNLHEAQLTTLSEIVEDLQQVARVSASQAAYIQRSIKRIAQRYKQQHEVDIFGKLFAEFCLALGTPRYDALPAKRYDQAIRWIEEQAATLLPNDLQALLPFQEPLI